MKKWNKKPNSFTEAFNKYRTYLPFLKFDLGFSPRLAFQGWVSEDILVDNSFVQGDVHRVPGEKEQRQDQLGTSFSPGLEGPGGGQYPTPQ
ncbi:hypothetical protein I79_011745 [Cricetulus griseus]|uniref:Uncharacterized protein n=1 Tax=Cricetulus griseus TaxID=10029 RepID=G3HM01_CRIGR|nr:hypothetical protein I79_011745 [Cricetulus griseus]